MSRLISDHKATFTRVYPKGLVRFSRDGSTWTSELVTLPALPTGSKRFDWMGENANLATLESAMASRFGA